MLAARSSVARATRRSFATVVDTAAGVKVASVDAGQPTSSVTFLVNAGSRYEPKAGVANALKNFAFKSTAKRSALGTVREAELYGGILSSSLTREHLAITAEFLRGDEPFFVDLLSSFVTSGRFTRHEWQEYVEPVVSSESTAALANPATKALEIAHNVAFRNGLGSSLFAPEHHHIESEDIKAFAGNVFTKSNLAVLGTGIDQGVLSKLVESGLKGISTSAEAESSPPSKYFGGESRIESTGLQTIFIGYGSTTPSAELAALASYLSPTPSIKWSSHSTSPLAQIIADTPGAAVQSVYLPYTDATLVGAIVQAQDTESVRKVGKAVLAAMGEAGKAKAEDVKKAVAKARFEMLSGVERKEGMVGVLGAKVLAGQPSTLDATVSALDKVTPTAFSKAAQTLLKSKPTYVAVGDTRSLPFVDELQA